MKAVLQALARATPGPLMLRGVVAGAGFAALLLAVPAPLRIAPLLLVCAGLSVIAAVAPGSAWVSVVEYLTVLGWLGATVLGRYDASLASVFALAVALYLHHSAAALAAVVPADAVVDPRVLQAWAVRAGLVLAVSAVLGIALLALPGLLGRSASVVTPVLGLAALVAAGYLLVRLVRRID